MTTGKRSAAGTQNEVVLFAYGDFGHAGPIVLGGGDEGFFQAGDVDEFKVNGLFNDALNTFYLRLYGVGQMVEVATRGLPGRGRRRIQGKRRKRFV